MPPKQKKRTRKSLVKKGGTKAQGATAQIKVEVSDFKQDKQDDAMDTQKMFEHGPGITETSLKFRSGPDLKFNYKMAIDKMLRHAKLKPRATDNMLGCSRILKWVSGMSGTDAPAVVIDHLLPKCHRELWAADPYAAAQVFLVNAIGKHAEHVYCDSQSTLKGIPAPCVLHGGKVCAIPTDEQDLAVFGFECKLNSQRGNDRYARDCVWPEGTNAHMETYYISYNHVKKFRPKVVILENVEGVLRRRGGESDDSVLEFLLNDKEWGLRNLHDYDVHVKMLRSTDFYLPQPRPRVWILLIRGDVARPPEQLEVLWRRLEGTLGEPYPIRSFLLPLDHELLAEGARPLFAEPNLELDDECAADIADYYNSFKDLLACAVQANLLPPRHKFPTLTDRISRNMDRHPAWPMTQWTLANIDVHHEIIKLKLGKLQLESDDNHSGVIATPVADVSQKPGRSGIQLYGGCPTLCTTSRLFWFVKGEAGFLLPHEHFSLQGWPVDQINLAHLTPGEAFTLPGNAMSLTTLAAPVMIALWILGFLEEFGPQANHIEARAKGA